MSSDNHTKQCIWIAVSVDGFGDKATAKIIRSLIRKDAMTSKILDENQYFKLVAGVAIMNDCKLLSIDFPERIIRLTGPPDAVRLCSDELENLLGRYQPE